MPTYICKGCGKETNSVCSQFNRGNPPDFCYAARVGDKWVQGCGFDRADDFSKAYAASLITGQPITRFYKTIN